jgi:hypothetical protein
VLLPTAPGLGRDEISRDSSKDSSLEYKLMPLNAQPYVDFVSEMISITKIIREKAKVHGNLVPNKIFF